MEEIQLLNHYIMRKDVKFLHSLEITPDHFITTGHIFEWVEQFRKENNVFPNRGTVASEFEEFDVYEELESPEYLASVVKNNKAFVDYKPVLIKNAEMLQEQNAIDVMWRMRADLDGLLKEHISKPTRYDWVKDARSRFDAYMEKHGKEGLTGLTTGIPGLDEATGGWQNDDLVLISGRLGNGKSLIGCYFLYHVWLSFVRASINSPVIYISTEMPKLSIAYRLDTMRQHFSNKALNRGKLADIELYKEYLEELEKKNNSLLILTQEDNKGRQFTPNDIRSIIELERPGFIVIDQLYDISDGTSERDTRKRIVNTSNAIREINLNTLTPAMLLAQAGRGAAGDSTPEIHQIQESDNPAQKATRVVTVNLSGDLFKLSLKKNREGEKNLDFYLSTNVDQGIYMETDEASLNM
ncbi:Replicative DNA helicase [Anaerovirgula multivorans]|uniref:Replicative DNA helicase n=1 Tax=Anaerovirgula multivorans TaxID=312168 RepID=A0A239CNL7_9FIRM|nr:DnaB-like helicase C-terminal domain-containing protein [Anaerovirgula multivorans]SNS21328.1 Replicative DNA helicase [Anaerovirgula multivorans]